jgi:hypothetical protein
MNDGIPFSPTHWEGLSLLTSAAETVEVGKKSEITASEWQTENMCSKLI